VSVKFDNSIISQIQQRTEIVEVIGEHLSLQKKGKEFVGLCPFHQDHKPSMYVNPVKQIFKCFACGAGGDVFKFVQLRENLSFPEAVERLAERAGMKLESWKGSGSGKRDSSEGGDPKLIARANLWSLKFWRKNYLDEQKGSVARTYLKERQISDESSELWGIGFAVDSWENLISSARAAKISEELLLQAGLVVNKEAGRYYDKFRNRLMFPILDVTGRVIGFGGRTLGDDPAKYMNSPATVLFDKSNAVYGLDKARHEIVSSGTVIVVEGYTDVIMAHQFGCKNVIATLGTSFTVGHGRLLRRYAKRIVLVFDSDVAGAEAANRALEVCLSQGIDIKIAFVSEGKDPCDFLLESGADAFRRIVAEAVDVMEFKWARFTESFSGSDNLSDKKATAQEYLRTIALAIKGGRVDPIGKGLIVGRLSEIIGLEKSQINRELSVLYGRLSRTEGFSVRNQKVVSVDFGSGSFAKAQQELLEVLLNKPALFAEVSGKIDVEVFDIPIFREIAEAVFGLLCEGKTLVLAEVLSRVESVQAGSAVVELSEMGEKKGEYKKRLEKAAALIQGRLEETKKDKFKEALADDETEALQKIHEILVRKDRSDKSNFEMKST